MIKLGLFISVLFLQILLLNNQALAQQDSTVKKEKHLKNTARINITNPLIFGGKTLILGYERTLGDHHSICIDGGLLTLPKLLPGTINVNDSIQLAANTSEKGYHFSVEYRFYLRKENKFNSPRGVYLAPYISYNYFNRKNTWDLNTVNYQGELSTDFTLNVSTLGGEFGYQFVLWKRVAIDLVLFGPGLANYSIKAKLSTTLEPEDQSALLKKINDKLADKIPGYSLVIDDTEFESKGTTNTTSVGFRYMVNIGFRF